MCSFCIKTTGYTVELEGIDSPARIVVVADLHGKEYGSQNRRLLQKVRAQEPDAIVLLAATAPGFILTALILSVRCNVFNKRSI